MALLARVRSVCSALRIPAPSGLVGVDTQGALSMLALANEAGAEIAAHHAWSGLNTEHTFATADGQEAYALPADLTGIVDGTLWDRTDKRQFYSLANAQQWAALKGSATASSVSYRFRIRQRQLLLHPTPTSVHTIAFEYRSSAWAANAAYAAFDDEFLADDDTTRFPERLLGLCLKWKLLRARGLDYAQEEQDFRDAQELAVAQDEPTGTLLVAGGETDVHLLGTDNIPDTGFG
jgi:hypothetical protein